MKEIFIDINGRSSDSITATESDNNSDTYKIVLTENDRRIDLTGKTIRMAYVLDCTDTGDVLDLNITNPAEGEITLSVTEILTKKNGSYTCQIVILGEEAYRKHTNYFNLSIRENLFNKISEEIEKDNINILNNLINGVEHNTEEIKKLKEVKKEKTRLRLTGGFEVLVKREGNAVYINVFGAATNGQLSGEGVLPKWAWPEEQLGTSISASAPNYNGILTITSDGYIYYFVATATSEVGVYAGNLSYTVS